MQRFTLPRNMYYGKGALEALKTLEDKKAIVCIGGGSMRHGGFPDRTVTYLKEADMGVRLFEGIESDSSAETIIRGADEMLAFEPGWIVVMGGGSPIGAVRVIWIKCGYPEVTLEDMCKVFGIPRLRKKAQFCIILSTSGTAAEVTAFPIITDHQKGIKYPIVDFEITPDVVIVDPGLIMTIPIRLVTHTGMDAVTHTVEAYVSTANDNFTNPLAIHTIEMTREHLVKSYNGDMDSRAAMHDAQHLAGRTSSDTLLGIAHSMAHKTGAVFTDQGAHIIHGAANVMYLPKVIRFNAKDKTIRKRYGVITNYMHLGDSSDEEKVDLLVTYLREMNDTLRIPHCIAHCGEDGLPAEEGFVSEDVFLARVEDITASAILGACTGSNLRQPSQEEMVELLKCCYYDIEVDSQYRN